MTSGDPARLTPARRRLVPGEPEAGGYRRLVGDERYWHPEPGADDDLPKARYGFPGAGTAADRNVILTVDWPRGR